METLATLLIADAITAFFLRGYLKRQQIVEQRPREAASRGQIHTDGPQSQHPHIDADHCIGCAACTSVCPEGDVLAMLGGWTVGVTTASMAYRQRCVVPEPARGVEVASVATSDWPRTGTPRLELSAGAAAWSDRLRYSGADVR